MERVAQLPAECGDPEMFDMLANFHSVLGKKKKKKPPSEYFSFKLKNKFDKHTHTKKRPQIDQQVKENCRKKKTQNKNENKKPK